MEKSPSPQRRLGHNTSTSATASSMAARPRGHRGRCGGILGCNDEKYIHYMMWYDIILHCSTLYFIMFCYVVLYYIYIYRIDIQSVCVCVPVSADLLQKLPKKKTQEPWAVLQVFAPDSTTGDGLWFKCEPQTRCLAQKRRLQLHGLWSSPVIIYIYVYIYILYKDKGSII